jgi:2,5-diamino-6-(ribosylamino)-4(3H)-pyrimidinone 5'-phosphate reductase
MTLDGKIATVAGDSRISSEADLDRLHRLRSKVDAVMVGAGTVIADNPSLTVRRVKGKNPLRVIIDGHARIPFDSKVLDQSAKTIVVVSNAAKGKKIKRLFLTGAEIIVHRGKSVDLRMLLEELYSRGIRRLLLEGGSNLNWNMLKSGLVDEIRIAVAPKLVGGELAKTLVGGAGFSRVKNGIDLKLSGVSRSGNELLLIYRVVGVGSD